MRGSFIKSVFLAFFSIIIFCNISVTDVFADDGYIARDGMCSMSDSSINRMESEHFQIIWGNSDSTGTVNEEFVKGNLENLENIRAFYVNELKMNDTSLAAYGGNTTHYKTNLYIADTGLTEITTDWAYMTVDPEGYAYLVTSPGAMRVDEPSWVLPHEYAHAIVYHQGGAVQHQWAEPLANWYRDQFLGSTYYKYGDKVYGPTSDFFAPMLLKSDYYFPHMLNYYDAWPILLYVSDNPDNIDGLGLDTMIAAIKDKTDNENMLDRISRLSGVSVKDLLGYYSRRMVTLDFDRQEHYLKQLDTLLADSSNKDAIYTTLTADGDYLAVPDNKAPMQQGFNVIPLDVDLSQKSITVNFVSTSSDANADFRVNIVTKTSDNTTRYSTMWNNGENSIGLHGDETVAYLVVCATPDNMQQLETFDENAVSTRFTYKIQVSASDKVVADNSDTESGSDNNNAPEADNSVNNESGTDNNASADNNAGITDDGNTEDTTGNDIPDNGSSDNTNTGDNSSENTDTNDSASSDDMDDTPQTGDAAMIFIALAVCGLSLYAIIKYKQSKQVY